MQWGDQKYSRVSPGLLLLMSLVLSSRAVGHMTPAEDAQSSGYLNTAAVLPSQAGVFQGKAATPTAAAAAAASVSVSASASISTSTVVEDIAADLGVELHHSLRFEPPYVDFGALSVGTTHSQQVTLVNQNNNRSVYLSSVSGRTPAFYSSFFEAKIVPPQGNTTFNVVFLPRKYGEVATELLIHTSFGQARLLVRGEGRECPYRLKPIVGIKAPLNATLMPEIHMYNPHERPLQILEVYSSGGQFQLELPSGAQEAPQTLWEIPAHTTKPIIRIRFHGTIAGNYTAYIRIKISEHVSKDAHDTSSEQVLVVPVEFEILSKYGLYTENPLFDFGRLTTNEKASLKRRLELRQSSARHLFELTDQFLRPVPGLNFDPTTTSVILDPQSFTATTHLDELMLIRTISKLNSSSEHQLQTQMQPQEFSVLVRASVFKGSLTFNKNVTTFVTHADHYVSGQLRKLVVHNEFEFPLKLLNISVLQNDSSVLHVCFGKTYTGPGMVLAPGAALELLQLRVLNDSHNFRTVLRIYTNVTLFELPIIICSGRLHVSAQDSSTELLLNAAYNVKLNLGAIPLAEMSHNGYIVLQNRNPLTIKLSTWDFQSAQDVYFHTTFLGCLRASTLNQRNQTTVKIDDAKFSFCSHLNEGDAAIFQVAIQSYITEPHAGTLKIWTAYELITTTVEFSTWVGKLEVDQEQLYFKNCFPGQLCSSDLSVRSSFKYPIHLTSIGFAEKALLFEDFNANGSIIAPESTTQVGRIHFEPAVLCQHRCYIPLDGKSVAMAFPLPHETKGGENNNMHFDDVELRRRAELFRHMKYFQSTSLTLNSREVRQVQLQLFIDLEWPKLVDSGKYVLPTVEIGKLQRLTVVIRNPARSTILVDYFLADPNYAQQTQLSLPHEVVDSSSGCYLTNRAVFNLPYGRPQKPVLILPGGNHSLEVVFESETPDTHCTLLHIRNNLTLYEAVWLSARTVQSQFRFGNRKPGATTPLLFELNEKQLEVCTQRTESRNVHREAEELHALLPPLIVTKRAFTARNKGEIPIRVDGFLIGNRRCVGYGFKVLDCDSFELAANASKRIEIVFAPDYTSSNIAQALTLLTNLSYPVTYKLLALLPPSGVAACAELLPRPTWEARVRNAAVVLLATSFVLVVLAAHIDFSNIMHKQTLLYSLRERATLHHFNLRNVATNKARLSNSFSGDEAADEQSETTALPGNAQNASSLSRTSCQQKLGSNSHNNNNNLKKRAVRKMNNCNGGRETAMNATTEAWPPLDLATTPTAKHVPTFSERNFKLRLEKATKQSILVQSSSSSASSTESGSNRLLNAWSKETATNQLNAIGPQSGTNIANGTNSGSKKQHQRALKKQKNSSPQQHLRASNAAGEDTGREDNSQKRQKESIGPRTTDKQTVGAESAKAANTFVKSAVDVWNKVLDTSNPLLGANLSLQQQQELLLTNTPSTPYTAAASKEHTTARKYGKTPGRERKKDTQNQHCASSITGVGGSDASSTNSCSTTSSSSSSSCSNTSSKRSERNKQAKNKAVNALNFNKSGATPSALLGTGVNYNLLPWERNQVSFSDVLQQTQTASNAIAPNIVNHDNKGKCSGAKSSPQPQEEQEEHALLQLDLGSQQQHEETNALAHIPIANNSKGNDNDNSNSNDGGFNNKNCVAGINSSTDLGPIGPRKSPSSTPVWEALTGSVNVANGMQLPKPTLSNNSSFFSNVALPPQPPSHTTFGATASATAGNTGYNDPQQFVGVSTGLYELEYLLNLRQQQLQAQQQLQVQQQLMQNVETTNNWTTSMNAPTWYAQGDNNTVNNWSNTALSMIRPPPGLENNFQTSAHLQQPQPHAQQRHALQQHPQQQQEMQQQISLASNGNHMNGSETTMGADMHTFDPFSSLSSIWSENWNRNNHNNNNSSSNNNSNMN